MSTQLLSKGTIVQHPRYGRGAIVEFYEFYNVTFVDVIFENYVAGEEPVYLRLDDLKIE
jgi:hypothetical protein